MYSHSSLSLGKLGSNAPPEPLQAFNHLSLKTGKDAEVTVPGKNVVISCSHISVDQIVEIILPGE
jgi:hypothetical protein